jgi:hypothetical protein
MSRNGQGENMKELTAAEILGMEDIVEELVDVPEWKGTVRVRGLTGRERDAYEASLLEQRGRNTRANLQNARAKLVVLSVRNVDGSRMFNEAQIGELSAKSASALNRVWKKALELSGMGDADVEELTLGFDDAPSSVSNTDSP